MRVQRSRHSASVGAMPSALNTLYTLLAEAALLLGDQVPGLVELGLPFGVMGLWVAPGMI